MLPIVARSAIASQRVAANKMMLNTVSRRNASYLSSLDPTVRHTLYTCIGGFFVAAGLMTGFYYQLSPMKKIFRDRAHNMHH